MLTIRDCNDDERRLIEQHVATILERIEYVPVGSSLVDRGLASLPVVERALRRDDVPRVLRRRLLRALDGSTELVLDCSPDTDQCQFLQGRYHPEKDVIQICSPEPDDPAVVFHELVHACGGNEFDAEVYENLLFDSAAGATMPSDRELDEFEADGYEGEFASYDPEADAIFSVEGDRLDLAPAQFTNGK